MNTASLVGNSHGFGRFLFFFTAFAAAVFVQIPQSVPAAHHFSKQPVQDIYNTIRQGAQATGSTSGIIRADDPCAMVGEMRYNLRKAWDDMHETKTSTHKKRMMPLTKIS